MTTPRLAISLTFSLAGVNPPPSVKCVIYYSANKLLMSLSIKRNLREGFNSTSRLFIVISLIYNATAHLTSYSDSVSNCQVLIHKSGYNDIGFRNPHTLKHRITIWNVPMYNTQIQCTNRIYFMLIQITTLLWFSSIFDSLLMSIQFVFISFNHV